MKRLLYFMTIVLIASFIISCNKDENEATSTEITDDLADEIAASIGESNSGLSSEITEVVEITDEYVSSEYVSSNLKSTLSDTVYSVDTSFLRENLAGSVVTFSYSYQMEYGYIFENGSLNRIYYSSAVNGGYDAPRIGSTDSRNSDWSLTGLELSSSTYILNGNTTRTGNSISKVRNKSQISSNSQISLSNVKINKSTLSIVEGTLTWNITGTVNTQFYDYDAIVNYLGNGKAELTINGVKYTIDISSGEID